MQVLVEAPTNLERRLTVVVPSEKIEEEYHKRINNLAKTVKVKGFRAGKVPLDYIRQCYGESARKEALSNIIHISLKAAITQEKLTPVATPIVEPKSVIPGQPIEFIATFEVLPEVNTVQFELKSFEKTASFITDQDIENVFMHLRQQQASWHEVNRFAEEKDQIIVDFTGSMDGKEFKDGKAQNYPVIIGSKTMIPGFEEGLIGMKVGEEKVLSLTFPPNYFLEEFAGKAAEFKIKATKILEAKLPEINEAFIKKMGVKSGNLQDFFAEVRKNLEREMARVIKAKTKKQIFDYLLQQNPLEIPKALIEKETKRIHDELHPNHANHHDHTPAEMETFKEAGKRNVILGLLIAKLVKQHNILPDSDRIKSQIEQLASVYENPEQVVHWYADNKRAKAEVEMQVLEEQIIEKLMENTQVTEKTVSYNELVQSLQNYLTKD